MIRGGKSFVSSPPAFSNDAKKLLICTGNTVSIFSTSTGLQTSELEGHTALVTSVIVVPASTPASKILCFCWTASLDGTIRNWDFSVPELMKTINIRVPIFYMANLWGVMKTPDLFAYVSVGGTKKQDKQPNTLHGQIRKCNLAKSRLAGGVTLAERAESKKIRLHHTKNLTTLAFHPTERIVAAGDETGRILIWWGFGNKAFSLGSKLINGGLTNNEDDRPGVRGHDDADSCTMWHWHSAEVKLLLFSPDGAYLYSGGKEGVLVVWQLDTGKKKFLPRIGSPLLFFINSLDPSLSATLSASTILVLIFVLFYRYLADNQIHLLKMPSMAILKSIAGIKVQICERNHQPGDELTVVVNLVALSLDGCVMSTVETRLPEEGIGGLVSLKFWTSGLQNKDFSLSTVIYEPHRVSGVSAIAFHPTRHIAVSSSYGGDFKIWVGNNEIQRKGQMLQKTGWTCHAVGSYKKKPMTAAIFSADGSILAVAAETVITLWDHEKNVLVAVIGDSKESEYLVSLSHGSNPQVSVWSMSKLSIMWSYKLHAEAVACTQDDSSFAVLACLPESSKLAESNVTTLPSEDGAILLFKVGDPVPVATWFVKKALGGGLAFLHTNPSALEQKISHENPASVLLAYINGDHEYILFDPYGEQQACEQGMARRQSLSGFQETGQFGYASIYGELPEFDLKAGKQTLPAPFVASEKPWETIFSGSSHSLPPLTKLCSSFLESLLEKRTANVE
ncbi:WD repeat-containing protein 75 [Camellia lanceoleosa]|uniref:WD repeat-containing protein 75 n=1 Tax=Camellia lanceoleosa TaxID=1840588 RepID=A0ACC0H243_9ERIC|nr:WD repeat-containing protein 75 [Camellia lanceoleosa]